MNVKGAQGDVDTYPGREAEAWAFSVCLHLLQKPGLIPWLLEFTNTGLCFYEV